jgi:glucose/arabinose dehydrogenase
VKSKIIAHLAPTVTFLSLGLLTTNVSAGDGMALKQVVEGLTSPIALVSLDDGSGRLLIADQIGTVHILSKEGDMSDKLFFDVRDRLATLNKGFDERGLLGLALHPRFKENRRLFVVYSAPLRKGVPTNWNSTVHVSEFKVRETDRAQVDPASERVLLEIDKPYFNHNAGSLAFGPDGRLYISVGDGGNANDVGLGHSPQGNGQDTSTLLGKILRIDVDGKQPYGIPADNPFANGKGRPEIFAYGLRNSWGISFDRGGKRELFAGDVGQTMFEEVNLIVKGGNYGWNIREGFHCFDPKNPRKPPENCAKTGAAGEPLLDPIFEYKNINGFPKDPEGRGISVTGGYVYRGKALPKLTGRYVFADWSRGWAKPDGVVYVATRSDFGAAQKWTMEPLELLSHPKGEMGAYVVALGEDAEGELYVMTNGSNTLGGKTGKVFKLVAQ